AEVVDAIRSTGTNPRYLAGYDLHPDLSATADEAEAVADADLVVMGVPSHGFRATARLVAPHVRADAALVSLTKGFEQGTRRRMTQILAEEVPGRPVGVLTGPNLAKEILAGHVAASVVA